MKWILIGCLILAVSPTLPAQSDSNHLKLVEGIIRNYIPEGKIKYIPRVPGLVEFHIQKLEPRKIKGITAETRNNYIILSSNERDSLIRSLRNSIANKNVQPNQSEPTSMKVEKVSLIEFFDPEEEVAERQKASTNNTTDGQICMVSGPIFLRDKTIFLLYIFYQQNNTFLQELCFYKYEEGQWKKWIVVSGN